MKAADNLKNQDGTKVEVDDLIHCRWLLPVVPNETLDDQSIVLKDGKILDILPRPLSESHYQAKNRYDLSRHVILPGLINCHGHLAMSLFRGMGSDLPLQRWLEDHVWPLEGKWVGEEFIRDGSRLAMAEMLRTGTTFFSDMYFFPNIVAAVAEEMGMRAQIAFPVADFPSPWASQASEYLHKGLEVHDRYRHHPHIQTAFGPHAIYTVSEENLNRIAVLAEELDIGVHIHVHETVHEVEASVAQTGKRPLERLDALNLLSPRTQCVHMTQLLAQEIELLAAKGASVIHCPESNLILASGFCPLAKLLAHNIPVALGTDGAASNNDLDLFGEMQTAALLAKGVAEDAGAVDAKTILAMATIDAARILGLETEIGSIEKGKAADLIAVDLGGLSSQPVYNALSQLIYTPVGQHVTHSWINGKLLLQEGQFTGIDAQELINRGQRWADKIQADL